MNVRVATATGLIMALLVAGQAQEPENVRRRCVAHRNDAADAYPRPARGLRRQDRSRRGHRQGRAPGWAVDVAFAPAAAHDGRTVLIKVDDGVIIFPVSAKDRRAVAQGVVERIGTGAEAQEAAEHARATPTPLPARQRRGSFKATGALVY